MGAIETIAAIDPANREPDLRRPDRSDLSLWDESGASRWRVADSTRIARSAAANVAISIDTSRVVPIEEPPLIDLLTDTSAWRAGGGADLSISSVAGMPFRIVNTGDSTVEIVTYLRSLPMILEALDPMGIWRPIERWHWYSCGTGVLNRVNLPPGHALTGRIFRYAGGRRTMLRLRVLTDGHAILSPPFSGTIDPGQILPFRDDPRSYLGAYPVDTTR